MTVLFLYAQHTSRSIFHLFRARFLPLTVVAVLLSACGGSDGGGSGSNAIQHDASVSPDDSAVASDDSSVASDDSSVSSGDSSDTADAVQPLKVSGKPPAEVAPGAAYEFHPQVANPSGRPLHFSVENLPGWASLDPVSGALSGRPGAGDIGLYGAIRVTVSDGRDSVVLGPFSIDVVALGTGSVTLSWLPPIENSDGTPLQDLAGYTIYWGRSLDDLEYSASIENPGLTSYVIEHLTAGVWYFAAKSFDFEGIESTFSNTVSTTIP